jgi:hypothetical protein
MKSVSKKTTIVRSSLVHVIVVGGAIFLAGCSDKQKIAEQQRIIEEQRQAMERAAKIGEIQAMERAAKIGEIKGKLVASSVKGDSFLFVSIAEQLQELGSLEDNYLREKLGHDATIKAYIEGVSSFLAILENDSAYRKNKSKESANISQSLLDTNARSCEDLANVCNQLSAISNEIEKSGVKSSLADEWKKAENGLYASRVIALKSRLALDIVSFKQSMDYLALRADKITELARLTNQSPWDLHTTGGSDEDLKELVRKRQKLSDCTFDGLLGAISKINSSGLKDLKEALLNYYREQARVYAEVEAPASIPWGQYIPYIRAKRDKVVEKGDMCEREFSKFQSSSKIKNSTELAQELITALPADRSKELQTRLDQIITNRK